jgi:hypothetical protein
MLHFEAIDPVALDVLIGIQRNDFFADARLVGGTALALQIGHRVSIDLDLFGQRPIAALDARQELAALGPVFVRTQGKRVQGYTVRGVQVDLVEYPYPWLDDPVVVDGLRLASLRDIAGMKLAAIANRGTKKDFIDVAFLLERFAPRDLLSFYLRKFPDGAAFPVLKSLAFFDDAEEDPMPNMLLPCDWDATKTRITAAVSALGTV